MEKAIELVPDFLQAYDDLSNVYERLGEQQKFRDLMYRVLEIYPQHLTQHPDDAYRRMAFAVNLTYVGRNDEARREGEKALELSQGDPIMMYYGACLYSRLKEPKRAAEWLKNAVTNGYENFEWIKRDPDFDGIRNEPEYIELLKGK